MQDAKQGALEGQSPDADKPELTAPQQPEPAGKTSTIPSPSGCLHTVLANLPMQYKLSHPRVACASSIACLAALCSLSICFFAVLQCVLLCCALLARLHGYTSDHLVPHDLIWCLPRSSH